MTETRRSRSTEAFFGRRKGKTLRPLQMAALDAGLQRYRIDLSSAAPADLSTLFQRPVDAVCLEIGFGGGEHILHRARHNLETGFIGVEPFVNSMAKMLSVLADEPSGNLRVHDDDATRLLDWLPEGSLAGIDLLYPDPWPKKKHLKRRFVNDQNLVRMARALRIGGTFRFASDIPGYVNWTLLHCGRSGAFEWQARDSSDWLNPYADWPGTRYEAKALRESRAPAYLTFHRI